MVSISDLYEFVKTSDNNFTSPKVKIFFNEASTSKIKEQHQAKNYQRY